MNIIAMGDIHMATHEAAAIAGLTNGDRLTVAIINSALSTYLQ